MASLQVVPESRYDLQEQRIAELEAERDEWETKNSAAVGLLNKLGERCKRKEEELQALREEMAR